MSDRVMIEDRSLASPDLVEDPYPYFHRLRAEDPVHWSEVHRAWLLTRYADVTCAFRDSRLSSERVGSMLPLESSPEEREAFDPIVRLLANWMVFKDPPAHVRLRRLARAAFTMRSMESLRPLVDEVVAELVARLGAARGGDLVRDFAFPLPASVIAAVLGVPREDQETFRRWSEEISPIVFGAATAEARREQAPRGLLQLEAYFGELLDRYRREPADNLLSALATAEEMGDVLSHDEVVATCILLLFAGHETTTNLVGSGFLALDRHREQKERLAADPALAASAVEELLRYDGPSKVQVRLAVEDLQIDSRPIRRGQRVFLVQAAANRDPARFRDPDRLDLARADNDHLGFGYGIHHCLGAPLARLEAQVAFGALLRALPSLRVAVERPEWSAAILGRGLRRLPVAL